jgi:hypothetical protein
MQNTSPYSPNHFQEDKQMIFTLIQISAVLLILYLLVHELKDSWTTHKEMKKLNKKWDEWEKIPGFWDVYMAERGGVKGLARKVESVEVKTSTEDETDEIGATSITPKIIPRHSIAAAH